MQKRSSRFRGVLPAVLHWNGRDHGCRAIDLSRSGALLRGDLPHDAGPEVAVTLTSTGRDLSVRLAARVRRVRRDGTDEVHLGIQFLPPSGAAADALERLVSRVIEGGAPALLETLPEKPTAQEVRGALERVPLTHRVQLAARATTRERGILMHDTDLHVLEALARNPNLTPHEMRSLLRNRHLLPSTLQALARDSRWTGSEDMKIALACHPSTPYGLAKQLIDTLTPAGRKKALTQPGLNPTLRIELGARTH